MTESRRGTSHQDDERPNSPYWKQTAIRLPCGQTPNVRCSGAAFCQGRLLQPKTCRAVITRHRECRSTALTLKQKSSFFSLYPSSCAARPRRQSRQ